MIYAPQVLPPDERAGGRIKGMIDGQRALQGRGIR